MPINPRIALGVEPGPAPYTPGELEQRRLTLADLGRREQLDQQQAELNDMRIAQGKRQQAEYDASLERARKVSEIYSKHLKPGDDERTVLKRALPEIWGVDPDAAAKIDEQVYNLDKRDMELRDRELKLASDRAKRFAAIANTVTDQASLRRALGMAAAEKLLTTEQIAQFGDTWDENSAATVKQIRDSALDVQKQLDEARKNDEHGWKKAEEERKAAKEARDAELHKATLPGKTADPKTGLTPMQTATVEGQKAARGETARHNRATEAKDAGGEDDAGKQARSAIAKLDTEAKGLQGKIDSRESAKAPLRKKKTQLESEIAFLEKEKPKKWQETVAKKRAEWQGNEAQLREIEAQQQDMVRRKDDLYGQIRGIKGGGGNSGSAPTTAEDLFKSYGK